MTGKLYGVGVGPGDPELITLKALRLTKEADILAFQGENTKESVAYRIMKGAYPEIDSKQMISLPMPMIKDREELKRVHDEGAKIIAEWLEKGKNVVFLTLGDPTVYSTYIYVHKRVEQLGYATQKSSAALHPFVQSVPDLMKRTGGKNPAASCNPTLYQIEEALKLPRNEVLMKTGKNAGSKSTDQSIW